MKFTTYKTVATCSSSKRITEYPFKINVFPSIPSIHSLYSGSGSDEFSFFIR